MYPRLGLGLALTDIRNQVRGEGVSTAVGGFTLPGATGDFSVTGLGFEPKAIIFFSSCVGTEDTFQIHSCQHIGITDGTNDRCGYAASIDNVATADTYREFRNDACINFYSLASKTLNTRATLSSFDSDGFTLNFSTNISSTVEVYYIAYGGNDLTFEVGSFDTPTVTGVQNVSTGLDTADFLFLVGGAGGSSNENTLKDISLFSMGAASSATEQGATSTRSNDNVGSTESFRYQSQSKCYAQPSSTGTLLDEAEFDGFTSSGFDVDWTTKDGTSRRIYYLTAKGGQWEVGRNTTKNSTGTQAYTTSFEPKSLCIFSAQSEAAPPVNHILNSFGASDGTTNRGFVTFDENAQTTTDAGRLNSTTSCLNMTDFTPALLDEANVDSFNPTDFTLDFTTADASQRPFIWWVVGDT